MILATIDKSTHSATFTYFVKKNGDLFRNEKRAEESHQPLVKVIVDANTYAQEIDLILASAVQLIIDTQVPDTISELKSAIVKHKEKAETIGRIADQVFGAAMYEKAAKLEQREKYHLKVVQIMQDKKMQLIQASA